MSRWTLSTAATKDWLDWYFQHRWTLWQHFHTPWTSSSNCIVYTNVVLENSKMIQPVWKWRHGTFYLWTLCISKKIQFQKNLKRQKMSIWYGWTLPVPHSHNGHHQFNLTRKRQFVTLLYQLKEVSCFDCQGHKNGTENEQVSWRDWQKADNLDVNR